MEEDSQRIVTSEVTIPINNTDEGADNDGIEHETLFTFSCPPCLLPNQANGSNSKALEYDSDGDIVVHRRQEKEVEETEMHLRISHWNSSTVEEVGRQVWRGALYLADFFLSGGIDIEGETLFEIGCGCGLTAIAAGICNAERVVASDLEQNIALAKKNVDVNSDHLRRSVQVIPFDVVDDVGRVPDELSGASLVYGADVVYDDELSEAIVDLVEMLLIKYPKMERRRFLFTVEKRFVFTIKDLRTVAHAFEYFMAKMKERLLEEGGQVHEMYDVKVEVMNGDKITQIFCYERSPEMVLVLIDAKLKR